MTRRGWGSKVRSLPTRPASRASQAHAYSASSLCGVVTDSRELWRRQSWRPVLFVRLLVRKCQRGARVQSGEMGLVTLQRWKWLQTRGRRRAVRHEREYRRRCLRLVRRAEGVVHGRRQSDPGVYRWRPQEDQRLPNLHGEWRDRVVSAVDSVFTPSGDPSLRWRRPDRAGAAGPRPR